MSTPMKEEFRATPKTPTKKVFKYPSEDERFVRRLGSALLENWNDVPVELREKIMADAALVWDREFGDAKLAAKLDAFVKRYPTRLA
jgi:hypothetical protein